MRSWQLSRAEFEQARTIARATFDGFLQSDLMPAGMQATAIIWAAAFLVGPSVLLPVNQMAKYAFLYRHFPHRVEAALWDDRMMFLLLSAGAMGLIAAVLWDTLFPARRDAFVLTPLPVPMPVQMLGRLGGILTLYVVFAIGLNVMPAILFPFVSMNAVARIPRAAAGHLIATASANAFVFFSVTAIQGAVILAFGRRVAMRLAAIVQAGAVLLVLLTLMFMTPIRMFVAAAVGGADPDSRALLFPVTWFFGLYESIAGTSRPIMSSLAAYGLLAAAVPVVFTIAVYALGYRRLLVRAVETPMRSTRSWLSRASARVLRATVVRRPEEQAIVSFTLRAISRSGRHTMLMAIYIGVALALVSTVLITDFARFGQDALISPLIEFRRRSGPPYAVLMAPLMLSAALAAGVRVLLTIPAEMNARWIYQTTALGVRRVDAAVHKTMLLIVVPPVLAAAAASALFLWGRAVVAPHAAFCGSLTLALAELLLLRFRGVPLTRPYVPGRSRIFVLWALYLSGFFTYTYSMAALERDLFVFGGPASVFRASEVFAGIALALWIWRKIDLRSAGDVPYEPAEPDDQMFQGFNLSEIHAAQSVATQKDQEAFSELRRAARLPPG